MNKIKYLVLISLFFVNTILGQMIFYNHPELTWKTFETPHFSVHYHNGAEWTAKECAEIAEAIYGPVTDYYSFEPDEKTDLIIKDIDDIANGAAYYYDNKIEILASPLNFMLRGNHSWLRDVVTHEFSHIVSLQKAMKYTRRVPGTYFQWIDYEKEKRDDVVTGYPNVIASYPLPGMVMPMWLAEGVAQNMWPGATNDMWDSHRDMLLRDRVLNDDMLSLDEMGHFGKIGVGNESVYNSGYRFVRYLNQKYGTQICPDLMDILSSPLQVSINTALKKATGVPGYQIYNEWKSELEDEYFNNTSEIIENQEKGVVIFGENSSQFFPEWINDEAFFFLSNNGAQYLSQTALHSFNLNGKKRLSKIILEKAETKASLSKDGKSLYYSKKSKPNKNGSVFYDIYLYDLESEDDKQITHSRRAYNPILSPDEKKILFVSGKDGNASIVLLDLSSEPYRETELLKFSDGEQLFTVNWSPDQKQFAFDYAFNHGRDIYVYDFEKKDFSVLVDGHRDTRNPVYGPEGKYLYYSSDETGIFNIYRKDLATGEEELLTNVMGGAFMPVVNSKGHLLYSLYENQAFRIALIRDPKPLDKDEAVYKENFNLYSAEMLPVERLESFEGQKYKDKFSKFFIMPLARVDYKTFKPGFYFYSSEVINRFNIFGQAAMNKDKDRDLAIMLEYHQWKPTFYLEIFNQSRSIFDVNDTLESGHPGVFDYTFDLLQAYFGASLPGATQYNIFRFDIIASKFRTIADQSINNGSGTDNFYGFTYDYYRGLDFQLDWRYRKIASTSTPDTNPVKGLELRTWFSRNYDKFIEGFEVDNSYGTYQTKFTNNYYWRLEHEGIWHHRYPVVNKLNGNFKWRLGWISKYNVDSFFNFFAGGMPGLRGYPYYSMEGRHLLSFHYTWRCPLFVRKSIRLGPFMLENSIAGFYIEAGNAFSHITDYRSMDWDTFTDSPVNITKNMFNDFKKDIGFQLRFSGHSFYGYPTAISLDYVYGLDEFDVITDAGKSFTYGKEWRTYLTILFGL